MGSYKGCRQPWSGESWLAVLCEDNLSRSVVCDWGFSARVQDQVQNEKRTAKRLSSKSTWEPAFSQHAYISSLILLCWEGSTGPGLVNTASVYWVGKNCSSFLQAVLVLGFFSFSFVFTVKPKLFCKHKAAYYANNSCVNTV